MSPRFRSGFLQGEDIAQTYPLAQIAIPGLDMPAWLALAGGLVRGGVDDARGALTISNDAGYFCGLCVYRIDRLSAGRTLFVDHFIAFDLLDRIAAADALLAAIDRLAELRQCEAIHTCLPAAQGPLLDRFRSAGHEPKLFLLCKRRGENNAFGGHHTCARIECFVGGPTIEAGC